MQHKSQGGFLGVYKRGELSKELEDVVFKMKRNDLTDIMETKQGFLVLQVLEHYDEASIARQSQNEIMDKLYGSAWSPHARISQDAARAELRRHQTRFQTLPAAEARRFRK